MNADPRVLEGALQAARRALRELEDDQVPASLRRVVASSARRLPPPLARTLIQGLDRFEWLREKALEAWTDVDAAGDREAASIAFLRRPEGWEATVAAASEQRSVADLETTITGLEKRIAEMRRGFDVERERFSRDREQAEAQVHDSERKAAQAVTSVEEVRRAGQEAVRRLEGEIERLRVERDQLAASLEEADGRISFLREELLRERRNVPGSDSGPTWDVWVRRDPVRLARLLDEIHTAMQGNVEPTMSIEPPAPEPLRLPPGVRPDEGQAIRWLLNRQRPFTMIVDGYNVVHQWRDPITREKLNLALARLARLAEAPIRVVVVYDSSLGEEAHGGGGPGGIEIRFTSARRIADEEIIELARTIDDDIVVVTSDRAVREGCPRALGIWSEALKAWMS